MPHLAHRRALIIGVGTYLDSTIQSVPQTAREAEQIAAALQDERVAAYAPAHVTLLTHQQTTREKTLAALQALAEHARADDTVFIFFSGHGAWGDDGVYYFGTHDVQLGARGRFKANTGLSQTELLECLRAIPAKKILLIINACFSGALNPTLDAASTQPPFGAPPSERVLDELLASGEGRAIITASRDEQPSRFDWNEPHTFFGQALLDGLCGNEVATRSGYIGLAELYEFIYARVLARTQDAQPPQEPMLSLVGSVGAFPIAFAHGVNTPTDASLLQPISSASKGVRVVELNLEQNVGAGNQGINVQAGGDVRVGGDVVGESKSESQITNSPGAQINTLQVEKVEGGLTFAPVNTTNIYTDTYKPARFTRAWWLWAIQKYPLRFLLLAIAVWLALALLLKIFPFQDRLGWQSLGLNVPRATQIFRAGSMLFVGGNNTQHTCASPDVALWRQPAPNVAWERIAAPILCFELSGKGKVLTDITGFSASPANPERVYMATSNLGILVSDKSGESDSWYKPRNDGLTNLDILQVAAHPTQPERVYALGRGDGLYRSDDGGDTWRRLDMSEKVTCPSGSAPMQRILNSGAIGVTPTRVIVGTGDPENSSPSAHVSAGLYVSDDDVCWRKVHGEEYIEYRAIVPVSSDSERVLFHTRNWNKNPDEKPHEVWSLALDAPSVAPRLLWSYDRTLGAITAQGNNWYAASELGQVFQGALIGTGEVVELPALPICFLACDVAWARDDNENVPILLASPVFDDGNLFGGRVLRQGQVDWWHALAP